MTRVTFVESSGYTGAIYPDLNNNKEKNSKSFVPAVRRKSDPDLCGCVTSDVKEKKILFELLMKVLLSWLPCFPRRKKTIKQYKSVTSKLLWLLFC